MRWLVQYLPGIVAMKLFIPKRNARIFSSRIFSFCAATLGGLATLWLVCLASPASLAQQPPLKRPAGDRLPRDRSLMPLMHDVRKQVFSSRMEFMALLSHPEIREEIGLAEEEFEELSNSGRDLFQEIRTIYHSDRDPNQPTGQGEPRESAERHQQMVAKIAQKIREHDQEFMQQLRDSVNYSRFLEILVQARGNRAVIHEDVAKLIGLPAEKLEEVRAVSHKVWRDQWETMGDKMRDLIRGQEGQDPALQGMRREAQQLVERAENTVSQAVGQRLSSEHLEALKNLRGEPFELPEDFFELRPPPGPRGHGGDGSDDGSDHRHPKR